MNGHVGEKVDGFEGVHGGKGYGVRNMEGEMLLEFAEAMGMAVVNTWFRKSNSRKVTYESGGSKTVVDYVLLRKEERKLVRDVMFIPSEACIPQHKLMICVVGFCGQVGRRKEVFESRCRVWRLKEDEVRRTFLEKVQARVDVKGESGVESQWAELKNSFLEVADEVCGRTKGPPRHKETWWWNKDVAKVVEEKQTLFKIWRKSKTEVDRAAYCRAKRKVKRAVHQAQVDEQKSFGDMLDSENEKGTVFRVAKQMVGRNRDVVGTGCVRDGKGKIVSDEAEVKEVWKEYFAKLLNEEFDWNNDGLGEVDIVSGPAEIITTEEVRSAIAKTKSGKAAGPSGVVAEMLKASGEIGVQLVTELCNRIVFEGKIPSDWRRSWMVNVYKGKGDATECGSYRGIKLLDQVMKVLERVIDKKVRSKVDIDDMQFGFRPGRGTTDAIFIVRQVQERFLEKKKDLWMAFVDLEKAFDRVPREVVWWALRRLGVEEWLVRVIRAMYEGVTTAVKLKGGVSDEFEVKVGVHQGSVLSPLLFIIVLEALSREHREGLPWELLYADDLALLADSEEALLVKLRRWKEEMEAKGLRVNMGKTKVMCCRIRHEQAENSGKWPCGVCRKGVGVNSIKCVVCERWVHKKCSGVKGSLKEVEFRCSKCEGKGRGSSEVKKEVLLGPNGALECVDRFCYLGDMIGSGGGAEEASRARVRCAWGKFRELSPILTSRGASLKVKGIVYRACVQCVMTYGSETWAMKVDDMQRLERTEKMMIRWMCGVTLRNRVASEELRERLGIASVSDMVRRGRLRWFGHVERKGAEDWVSACRSLVVEGDRGWGRGRKTWKECVRDDMKRMNLTVADAQNRAVWRSGILGNRPTRVSMEIGT